jgi:hypothetical protein
MAIITSRSGAVDENVVRLQEILCGVSLGAIGFPNDPFATTKVGATMPDLLDQTEGLFVGLVDTLEQMGLDIIGMSYRLSNAEAQLDVAQDTLANLIGGIDYDEALDHAAADLMEGFCASGAADVSADGKLVFDERISFTKEDIKPMLREAIVRWVELKMGQ